ncbi:MAG: hypothetical protein FIB01_12135 [Gemmatimonadetes bacterium]|nr:hypothetical protein [Gemmatimonadota bacterium]
MTPRELALHVLQQRFAHPAPGVPNSPELAAFQQDAHDRLLAAVAAHGGALLADSVGLGKTFVAVAVARSLAVPGRATTVIVPTALVRLWRRALRGLGDVHMLTHAALSRGRAPAPERATGLVIVDEAHTFRNPRTRRYAALARLAAGRPLLLLSATPVNNSVWDLYWLLRLFAADDAFAELGVQDLRACFEEAHRTRRAGRIPAVLAAVAVRRSRRLVTELHGEVRVDGRVLRVPTRAPPSPVSYELPAPLVEAATGFVEALELRPWQDFGPAGGVCLLRLLLLKRLESSVAALRASVTRLGRVLEAFDASLGQGLLLAPSPARPDGDPAQLELAALVHRPVPPALDVAELRQSARRDLELLRACHRHLDDALLHDSKLAALTDLLGGELRDRPVLLFTEFRETAEYLWRSLRILIPCALIHGSGAWLGAGQSTRRGIIERFAPVSNGLPPPAPRERVQLLIATDVLAEGLNLQDAADVVSYDLPWNPVRLVQRLGRIDRLGSPHPCVRSWYFVPHRELEALLGLLHRIRRKLGAIRTTIGSEAPVLAFPARVSALRRLAAGDGAPFTEAERRRDGMFEIEERLRSAFRHAGHVRADPLEGLPLATGAAPTTPAHGRTERTHTCVAGGQLPVVALPASSLSAPYGRRERAQALVCVRAGAVHRAVFVGTRHCYEDDVAAGELLLAALEYRTPNTASTPAGAAGTASLAASRATQWLRRPRRARAGPVGIRLRKRALRLLQELPGGAGEADCLEVQALIEKLLGPLPASVEVALRPIASGPRTTLEALLGQTRECLKRDTGPFPDPARSRPSRAAGEAEVVGVFLLDAGG